MNKEIYVLLFNKSHVVMWDSALSRGYEFTIPNYIYRCAFLTYLTDSYAIF